MKRPLVVSSSCVLLAIGVAAAQHSSTPRLAQATAASPAQPKGFKAMPVFKSGMNARNKPIEYPAGKAEVTAVIAEFEPGGTNGLHQHPVPAFVYVLEGTLTLQGEDGTTQAYGPGQAFVEDVKFWHEAVNRGDRPVKIFALFIGQEGTPVTIRAK